jgi:hypothetical protein
METSQFDQRSQPRLIVNPVIQPYGKRWWVPREDLQERGTWLRAHGYWVTRYRNAAGQTIELTHGGLVGATGAATRDLLEVLATENQRAGVDVHVINAWRRAEMNRM